MNESRRVAEAEAKRRQQIADAKAAQERAAKAAGMMLKMIFFLSFQRKQTIKTLKYLYDSRS